MAVPELDIRDVVRQSGLTVATLHHYEAKGLIAPVGRRGLRRQYEPAVLDRLAVISFGRDAGFSLDEIATMFSPDKGVDIDRDRIRAKADDIDARIASLAATRDTLRHVAACPEPDHFSCPRFRELLAATTRQRRSDHLSGAEVGAGREGSTAHSTSLK